LPENGRLMAAFGARCGEQAPHVLFKFDSKSSSNILQIYPAGLQTTLDFRL